MGGWSIVFGVPHTSQKKRTWAAYACPMCRFVFRVSKQYDGSGIVCPACQNLLKVPTGEQALGHNRIESKDGFVGQGSEEVAVKGETQLANTKQLDRDFSDERKRNNG